MFKQIDFEKVIRANLIPNSNCHVYICEDTQTAFQLALKYGKYVRTHIIREKRDKREGFWKVYLSDGGRCIFCSEDYFLQSPIACSYLGFAG
ncbi:TPA: hypothetical protein ACG9AM_001859 [Enterococcus faecium]|uniref:Uncharacterized protein n=3 Tax=Enterococcus TaxID=1350 RepID=A0A286KC93_ENTAV|nr:MULTISPECIES: hypothetical protein [Enterococcus]EOF89253.1 hypothetical protein SKG_02709 [Enterococcus faecium EnGen0166]EOH41965.1 hypothetical protein SSI_03021 [Enterococcus faecium EnGen0191]EOM17964.1 hypothetical protein SSM_03077 [Enterococcus faecium EnGen0192]APB62456.1 hypothetical protein pEMA120_p45 [Enterococcus faecium]APB62536.1 hypothetical protein pEA19081_p40 [Enterococcus avium]